MSVRCRVIGGVGWPLVPLSVGLGLFLAGCFGGRSLPPYEDPLRPAPVQTVRTTAYTHTEADHVRYGRMSASGRPLRYGAVTSAAADWSRWPLGTRFQVIETGRVYEVDDYGWMLSGTNTIDLYHPTRAAMNRWGVRHVSIRILAWGDPVASHRILVPRRRHAHVDRMLDQFRDRHGLSRVVE